MKQKNNNNKKNSSSTRIVFKRGEINFLTEDE